MNKISRKGFLKIAAAAAMSGVTAGALAACNAASGSTSTAASTAASGDTIKVAFDTSRIHIFDKDTERCIAH